MENPQADGQEPDRRPTRRVEGAQHSEDVWYACGGKSGGSATEQRAITWGDLVVAGRREVSRGHSSRENEPGARVPVLKTTTKTTTIPEASTDEGPNQ
jgi:hypothetical protein